jgi:hypothetical protein
MKVSWQEHRANEQEQKLQGFIIPRLIDVIKLLQAVCMYEPCGSLRMLENSHDAHSSLKAVKDFCTEEERWITL